MNMMTLFQGVMLFALLVCVTDATIIYGSDSSPFSGVQTYVRKSGGKVIEIGIEVPEMFTADWWPLEFPNEMEFSLSFPKAARTFAGFRHLLGAWRPKGQEPKSIYGKKVFDFQWHYVDESERLKFTDPVMANNTPPASHLPYAFVPLAFVPQQGMHWASSMSDELQGQSFKNNLFYGTYDEKVTFLQAMMTFNFTANKLKKGITTFPFPQPLVYERKQKAFPTTFNVYYNKKKNGNGYYRGYFADFIDPNGILG